MLVIVPDREEAPAADEAAADLRKVLGTLTRGERAFCRSVAFRAVPMVAYRKTHAQLWVDAGDEVRVLDDRVPIIHTKAELIGQFRPFSGFNRRIATYHPTVRP